MNNQYNKSLGFTATIVALAIAQNVNATPTNIIDDYIGGNDHGYGDVIGSAANFNISSMDVERIGNTLSVSINTGFAGKGDNHLFDSLTNNKGIGYGDLFLSSSWNPYGTAPYISDNNANGTIWTYGFSLDNRWMNEALAGTGTLYNLSYWPGNSCGQNEQWHKRCCQQQQQLGHNVGQNQLPDRPDWHSTGFK